MNDKLVSTYMWRIINDEYASQNAHVVSFTVITFSKNGNFSTP